MEAPEFDEDYAVERWREGSKYFFSFSPPTYIYRGPRVRPAPPRPEGFVDESDYNFTGTMDTQYHHRSITPEVDKDIDKRKDSIDDYYEEMRQRKDSGLEPIPWKEWLNRTAFIRNAGDEGEYTLTEEARGNTAHMFMERAGLGGKTFHVQPAYRMEAEGMGMLPDQLQRQRSAEVEKYVNDILKEKGQHKGYDIRVEPEDWDTRERGAIASWWPGWGKIGIAENKINELTLLHEVAHALTNTVHDADSHGHQFRQTFHDLIHEKIGPEASGMYAELAFPSGISVDQMAFDYNKEAQRRIAMAWEDWAPQVQYIAGKDYANKNYTCTGKGCNFNNGSAGGYVIEHDDGSKSHLTFLHGQDKNYNPVLAIGGILTANDYRRDGIAEALMRRMVEDHPGVPISPGLLLPDGQAFHDRMLEKEPEARELVTAMRLAMAWDEWSPKIKGGCVDGCDRHTEGRYVIPEAGAFLNFVHGHHRGKPAAHIIGIYTHPENRNDGVAEALMRRLLEDHPGISVNPGDMTPDGQKFHDRMLDKDPSARELVTAVRLAMEARGTAP